MLSSIVSTLSPKKLLAASISRSLADFFHVDPEQVETNLVHDAKVTLQGIEIKQRRLGGLLVYGTVGHVEFSWTWGAGSLITDAKLIVKGVEIHVRLIKDNEEVCYANDGNSSSASLQFSDQTTLTVDNGKDSDWKSRYKQQIIDHLTLLVTGLSVSIQLSDESRVVLEAKDLDLQTLQQQTVGKDGASTLLQEISLGSIAAWIQDTGDTRYPILDQFGYHASVQRISGRRFLDGVLSGLMVQGKTRTTADESHASSAIRVHAGKQQLVGLNCLQQVLQSVGNGDSLPHGEEKVDNGKDWLKEVPEVTSFGVPSSICRLPFQSIEIVLEDDVKLRLEGCEIKYCMDGSELALHCTRGLWMHHFPILKHGAIIVDFVNSRLELAAFSSQQDQEVFYNAESTISDDAPTHTEGESIQLQNENGNVEFNFSIDLFRRLYSSVSAVLPEYQEAVALVQQRRELHSQLQSDLSTSAPWIIVSKQATSLRFEGQATWIQVTGTGFSIQQNQDKNGLPLIFACDSAELDCSSGLRITVPKMETKNETIACSERVAASFASVDSLMKLKTVWADVFSVIDSQSSTSIETVFEFATSGIDITCLDPKFGSISLDSLSRTGATWKLESVRIGDVMGLSMEARNLQLSVENDSQRLQIKEIPCCAYGGRTVISSPVQDLEFIRHQSSISISCGDLALMYPLQQRDEKPKEAGTTKVPMLELKLLEKYAKSFRLQAKKLRLSNDVGYELTTQTVDISLALVAQSKLHVSAGLMNVQNGDGQKLSCRGIKGNGSINITAQWSNLPVWKMFSSAVLTVGSIDTLMLPNLGHLHAPIENTNVSLANNLATARFKAIQFCCPKMEVESDVGVRSPSMILNLPNLRCQVQRLVLMPEFGTGKPGICFDGLGISHVLHDKVLQLKGDCNYIQGRGPNSLQFAIKQVKISAVKEAAVTSNEKVDLFGLQEAEVSANEISSFAAAGKFRLTKPITNFTARYGNGAIESTLGELNVLIEQARTSQMNDQLAGAYGLRLSLPLLSLPTVRVVVLRGAVEWISSKSPVFSRTCISFENSQIGMVQDSFGTRCNVNIDSVRGKCEDGSAVIVSRSQFEALVQHRFSNEGAMLESLSIPLFGSLQSAKILLSEIEAFHVPNVISLQSPTRNLEAKFSNNELVVSFEDVLLQRFLQEHIEQKVMQSPSIELPFKISLLIASLFIEDILQQKVSRRKIRCINLCLGLEPTLAKVGTGRESSGAGVFFRCQSLEIGDCSSVFGVPELSGSGLLQFNIPDTIGNLVVGLEKAQLEADFSSMEWSRPGQQQGIIMNLPFAAVSQFVLTLKCSGTLLRVEDATISCGSFEGTSETTLDVLKAHYMGVVQERIPYILAAKTSIAGANIGDSVGMMAGTLVTNTSVIGAAVGVASRDAVGSAVRQGKVARGADESEKYKFGDFTRGVVASVKEAAKSGAAMRDDEQYRFGDFTAGTTKAASSYASKNRMRLAGAGGSAAGMIAGAAILGPVGFVAGSLLGSSVAQSSVRSIVGEHGENDETKEPAAGSSQHESLLDNQTGLSRLQDVSNDATAPVSLDTQARMVGGIATSEQRIVMAQAQVVDLLSSEQPVASIAPAASISTQRSIQSPVHQAPVTQTVNAVPFQAQINNDGESYPLIADAASSPQHMSQYPIAPSTALPSSRPSAQATIPAVGAHGYQNQYHSGQQQRNRPAGVQSRSVQGVGVGRQHAPPSTSNRTTGSRQQEGYRFGDVTRGIIARGRQLDGRDENSGYKFGDFTRGLFR